MSIEEILTRKLTEQGINKIPARKAAQVLIYFKESYDKKTIPFNKRIPEVWRGMMELRIIPYVDENTERIKGLSPEHSKIYYYLDSIAIGIAVGIYKGLLAVCEHTEYSLTAKGLEFTQIDSKNKLKI